MFEKKSYALNCDVCDTRRMKEEDYSGYEKMLINTDVLLVSDASKSILNRLPVTVNQDCTVELPPEVEVEIKTVNGSYEITQATSVREHTVLTVNGNLFIHPGTQEALKRYAKICVNGSVKLPKSLDMGSESLSMSVNGSVSVYPDDGILLEPVFVLDKYFPLRAREGGKYYVEQELIIQDKSVDLGKLLEKKVQFITGRLILPEELVEAGVGLVDEKTALTVIPAGMSLHLGDAVLDGSLIEKEGGSIYVHGDLEAAPDCDWEALEGGVRRIAVSGEVRIRKSQEEALRRLNLEYGRLEYIWEGRILERMPSVRIDRALLENSPNQLQVRHCASVEIGKDVSAGLILERLMLEHCASVSCWEEQESAVAAVSSHVASIVRAVEAPASEGLPMDAPSPEGLPMGAPFQMPPGGEPGSQFPQWLKDLFGGKVINAESYIM